jgi:hypothetical protein
MKVQVVPPFAEYDQVTRKPDPTALNEAVAPDATVSLTGVITGAPGPS